jgi:predicted phage terminase large subunit-like protein
MTDDRQEPLVASREILRRLLRTDFPSFLHRCFQELVPGEEFRDNWHHELIAHNLERVRQGACPRLIITLPPRNLKSIQVTVALVAWVLGHNPSARVMCVSYSQELSEKHARDRLTLLRAPWYQEIFPGTRLKAKKPAAHHFETTAGGACFATSIGGVVTGMGADVIIIDDPLKPEEALSEVVRKRCNEFVENTLASRLNDKLTGKMILVMQRLHEDDLVGCLLEKGGWTHINLPAIAEQDEHFEIQTLNGSKIVGRKEGEALHPAREPLEVLHALHQDLGEYNFAGQYQQRPAPFGGGLIKQRWLRYYDPSEKPSELDHILQSWDTATKATELSDYSVCLTIGVKDGRFYFLDVLRERMDYPELKKAVRQQIARFRPNKIIIEDCASGTQLVQELTREGQWNISAVKPEGDKKMRLYAQTSPFENGLVLLPRMAPWLDAFVDELLVFPNGRYNDQVDALSQALAFLSDQLREPAFLIFMRKQYEELERQKQVDEKKPGPWRDRYGRPKV